MDRILVIDDDHAVTDALQRGLGLEGFAVDAANSGEEGLKLYRDRDPQLIILDVMMPGMNGIELCRRIRERPETTEIPIVMLSARGDPASVDAGLEAGADDYLQKPILHHDLLSKIRKMLDLQSVD